MPGSEDPRVAEVLAILPELRASRVEALIAKYGSAETVINRFFDGLIEERECQEQLTKTSPVKCLVSELIELDSSTSTSSTVDCEVRNVEIPEDPPDFNIYESNVNYDDDLPDIPEPKIEVAEAYKTQVEPIHSAIEQQPKDKIKRGRKKKEEPALSNENLAKALKKKLPTNVASVEVQLGSDLLKDSPLGNALNQALDQNGGMFEKNAALPCACNATVWSDAPHPQAIRWIYHKPVSVLENDEESSADVMYAAPGSEFIAEIQPELGIILSQTEFIDFCKNNKLTDFCRTVIALSGENYSRIVIITPDPEQYFKQRQTDQKKQFRQKMKAGQGFGGDDNEPSFEDIEMAICGIDFADPPVAIPVTFTFSTTFEHTAAIVRSMTKACCERPGKAAKRQWDSALVMEPGQTVNPVEKPYECWVRQLEQLSLVSGDVASAIASRYPNPMTLYCAAAANGPTFLADLEIRRGAGVLERTRRVGPECSRRLHLLYTAGTDPEAMFE